MKVTVDYPDPEVATRELLTTLLADLDAEVRIGIPATWDKTVDPPQVEVSWDGTPRRMASVAIWCLVRVVVHGNGLSAMKALTNTIIGRIEGGPTHPDIACITVDTGPLPAMDPTTRADLVSFNLEVCVRAVPVDPGS